MAVIQGTRLNTTAHLGDGRKVRGPMLGADGKRSEGEILEDVPNHIAKMLSDADLARVIGDYDDDGDVDSKDGDANGDDQVDRADIVALRAEYQAEFGKKPFNGWDAATLAAKIAAKD